MSLPQELHDIAVFDASPRADRLKLASAIALGPAFTAAPDLVGERGLLGFVHTPTNLTFVAIPGGELVMGLREDDIEDASEYIDFTSGVKGFIDQLAARTSPLRTVRVAPFLCATELLSEKTLTILSNGALTNPSFESYEAQKAGDFVAGLKDFRLVSEAELEWLAREGGRTHFVNDCGRVLEEGNEFPEVNGFGVRRLHYGEFAADAWHPDYRGAPATSIAWEASKTPGVRRGGLPFGVDQTDDEMLFGLAAYRAPAAESDEPMHIRLALRLL